MMDSCVPAFLVTPSEPEETGLQQNEQEDSQHDSVSDKNERRVTCQELQEPGNGCIADNRRGKGCRDQIRVAEAGGWQSFIDFILLGPSGPATQTGAP